MPAKVIVIGAGVAGMSAAHELARRGDFEVVVYEQRSVAGGKARSLDAIPGTGVKQGARLPRGARLIFRTVTLEKGQRVSMVLRAPAHTTLRGLVPANGAAIAFTVQRPMHFVGRRAVTVRASVAPKASAGEHTARIWALVR